MIVELNDGEYSFDCLNFIQSHSSDCIYLDFTFEKLPDILHRYAIASNFIKNIKVYHKFQSKYKDYLPRYTYAQIYQISNKEHCKVYMNSLSIEYRINNLKKRDCSRDKCNNIICESVVMPQLLPLVGKETAEGIWNSEDVILYCCQCYFDEVIEQGWLTSF